MAYIIQRRMQAPGQLNALPSRNRLAGTSDQKPDQDVASAGQRRSRLLWRHGPIALWIALIFWASTDQFSSEHTAQVIQPWIVWLFPRMSPETVDWLHGMVRKSAHVTEYAIFALLVARALMGSSRPLLSRGWFAMSCLLLAALAATDEYHQSFVASRTPAVTDVLIDTSGGFAALAALALWRRARNARLGQFDSVAFFREQRSESLWDFDIKEQEKAVVVRFAAPGFDAASLDVHLQGNLLILRACKQIEKKAKDRDPDELGFRELYRSVPLPSPVDAAKATATYCDGVLTVSLPKTDRNKVGRVLVQVSRIRQPPRAVEVARAIPRRLRNNLAQWPRPTLKPAVNSATRNHAVPKNRFG